MKKLLLIAIAVLIGFTGYAQTPNSKLDFRLGVGTSLLGSGDMKTIMFENEANFKLNNYLTLGGGLAYAKSDRGVFEQASFIQFNANTFISPFKNNQKNDFRIGGGVSWYSISDVYESNIFFQDGQAYPSYIFDKRSSVGFNIIVENTYSISEKYLLGLKAFTQPYLNGDINSGIMLKFGIKI